jgi:hypothetical protein
MLSIAPLRNLVTRESPSEFYQRREKTPRNHAAQKYLSACPFNALRLLLSVAVSFSMKLGLTDRVFRL